MNIVSRETYLTLTKCFLINNENIEWSRDEFK